MAQRVKQHEAVIETLERLGGLATLAQLNQQATRVEGCKWGTKTPFATIRRIVQVRREIYKIKPGLYGLVTHRARNEARGYVAGEVDATSNCKVAATDHAYYQGLLLCFGTIKNFDTYAPDKDRNRVWVDKTLGQIRTLQKIPAFTHPNLVRRSSTIDVIWFTKDKHLPDSFYEVEITTDIQNSLLKFLDLKEFNARMLIVADPRRKREFEAKLSYTAFHALQTRVKFLDLDSLVKQYEYAVASQHMDVLI